MADRLARSAREFRWATGGLSRAGRRAIENGVDADASVPAVGTSEGPAPARQVEIGRDYVELVESGALGALHVPTWTADDEAVFVAPAYTFLMRNRAVDVQFWLDIGAEGWGKRIYQPLTHPYVLSRNWSRGYSWSDEDEVRNRQDSLRRLSIGLLRRARRKVYLGFSEFSERGMEQSGPLLNLLNRVLEQAGD